MYETWIAVAQTQQWLNGYSLQCSDVQADKKTDNYLSYWFLLQVSSGTTGNCHIVLHIQRGIFRMATLKLLSLNTLHTAIYETEEQQKKEHHHTGFGLRSLRPASTFSMSENFVAPSASAIRMTFPLELRTPFKWDKQHIQMSNQQEVHSILLQTWVWQLQSYHPHSPSFPPVLHQRQDPHFICTVLPTVPQSNLAAHHKTHFY